MIQPTFASSFMEADLAKGMAKVRVKSIDAGAEDSKKLICVVGVGYVGEILLKEFGTHFSAIGFDVSPKRVEFLRPQFASLPNVKLTSEASEIADATHFLISVPTLLRSDKSVDAGHLHSAVSTVISYAKPGSAIVIESSVSVGMTRSILGQFQGRYHCGMSPERVDPGRTIPAAHEIPKVISGLDEKSLSVINEAYSKVFQKVVMVSSPEVAEMTKLYENCYRMINIAYINEIADACAQHRINVNEVVDAAATKPFGFQPFRPGLGVGGHCIPINPYYLMTNNKLPLLNKATKRMWDRPAKLARGYHRRQQFRSGRKAPRILVVGVAFKPKQSVISCSPALSFAKELNQIGCKRLSYYDPYVNQEQVGWMKKMSNKSFSAEYIDKHFDGVAVCMKQADVDYGVLKSLKRATVKYY